MWCEIHLNVYEYIDYLKYGRRRRLPKLKSVLTKIKMYKKDVFIPDNSTSPLDYLDMILETFMNMLGTSKIVKVIQITVKDYFKTFKGYFCVKRFKEWWDDCVLINNSLRIPRQIKRPNLIYKKIRKLLPNIKLFNENQKITKPFIYLLVKAINNYQEVSLMGLNS